MSDFPETVGTQVPSIRPTPPAPELPLVPDQLTPLHGWGRANASRAHVASIDSVAGAVSALRQAESGGYAARGVTPRGLGRSYGDAAQNAGGTALDLTTLNRILHVDAEADPPTVDVQAGVSLDKLMKALLPFGLWVPVLPGTRQVTIGGAIAADVHGKNHHTEGSFGNHVRSLRLLVADGRVLDLSPDSADPDDNAAFWATVGGMGLTGVVLSAVLELKRAETAYFSVDTDRTADLDELMTAMATGDENYTYSVAWFDAVSTGKHLGRAVLTRGRAAKLADLPAKLRPRALEFKAPSFGTIPAIFPNRLVNKATGKAFSEFWYRKAPKHRVGEIQNITQFFHPLDIVSEWNRLYGPNGFLQYQFVVPFGAEDTFARCVELIATSGHVSCLNVLKRFGAANPGPLSFPTPGWTLAVDLPIEPGLDRLCDRLDEQVLSVGGRIYLAKDSRLSAATFRQMYPRLDDFMAVRRRLDPNAVFTSDLARRLDLV
ncbi:decaprenylphospho-beta-D-ribofuranose 2-oxidase [Friedmanniella endophytica]|uniref:Decaprenylphospho-beta-D-ribofuranose 2-oxidase n=1 Tax=Microlunatus kandeliicorticis TaxID=1759536 RepID=A0A7W3P4W6_9ACTN|nr:FAD-binding oxidoreductase [Microlunatus kandeliicorticis]MBA8793333.1 decaprenylphospho-beta-D-ribofuranose 2-oxidase [Microlunatus kandeliicorticis]